MDYAATTPVDPQVAQVMMKFMTPEGIFGNPASTGHRAGREARVAVEHAREQIAKLVNCDSKEIVFTSGATESDNLAIKGVAKFHGRRGKHIITSKIEHKAVIDTCRCLEKEGYEVTWLKPGKDGLISPQSVKVELRDETILVSIMHANNEIGTINDIAGIGEALESHKCLFHVDAAQSAGKVSIDLQSMNIDLMSFSAHKIYGPKGMGALYVRHEPRTLIAPLIHGGGHEQGMRSGTLATHQIAGMGEAFAIAKTELELEAKRLKALREKLWAGVRELPGVIRNSPVEACLPGLINISFAAVVGESLQLAACEVAVSAGSACNSNNVVASYVLRTIGLDDFQASSALRFSLGRFTTEQDVEMVIRCLNREYIRLVELAPVDSDVT